MLKLFACSALLITSLASAANLSLDTLDAVVIKAEVSPGILAVAPPVTLKRFLK